MKTEHKTSASAQADMQLRRQLKENMPEIAPNPWFTAKVMNRLPPPPERPRRWAWVETACYLLGGVGLAAVWILLFIFALTKGITLSLLCCAALMPVLTLFCVFVVSYPALQRAFRN